MSTTNRSLVHSYLDICSIDPAAVMQSHARNRSTDPRVLNSSEMTAAGAAVVEKNQIIMIPVAKCDSAKINEIAESMMVVRSLKQAERIKQFRSRLLHIHNCAHCLEFNNA